MTKHTQAWEPGEPGDQTSVHDLICATLEHLVQVGTQGIFSLRRLLSFLSAEDAVVAGAGSHIDAPVLTSSCLGDVANVYAKVPHRNLRKGAPACRGLFLDAGVR